MSETRKVGPDALLGVFTEMYGPAGTPDGTLLISALSIEGLLLGTGRMRGRWTTADVETTLNGLLGDARAATTLSALLVGYAVPPTAMRAAYEACEAVLPTRVLAATSESTVVRLA